MDELEEIPSILADVAHMPARVKCACLRMAKGNARKKGLAANARHVMNNRFRFDAPSVADEEELDDQLVAYNLQKVPCRQEEPLLNSAAAPIMKKELVGGVLACSILWNILSIESVWVAENYRGQGIAARLLKRSREEEAKAAGCYMAQLDTFDFQAPGFYEKQGYEIFGTLIMHQRDIHIIT